MVAHFRGHHHLALRLSGNLHLILVRLQTLVRDAHRPLAILGVSWTWRILVFKSWVKHRGKDISVGYQKG